MAFEEFDTEETIQEPSLQMVDGELVDTTEYDAPEDTTDEEESASSSEEESTDSSEEAQPDESSEKYEEVEETETDSPEDSTATEQPDDEDDEAFYESLSKEVGFDLKSEEDITQALKDYAQLKNSNPLEDAELKAFHEFKQSGGDTAQFHALKSKNFESMDSKELLKEKFMLDHKDLVKDNPKLAESRFQREMKNKYGILNTDLESMDEDERQEWEAENKEEFEALKMELEYDTEQARKSLTEWQQKATSPQSQKEEMTAEQAQQIQQEWESNLKQATESFEGFDIKVGEGVDDFKLGIAPDELKQLSEQVKDPGNFVAELTGFDAETGKVDANKLMQVAAKLKKFDELGALMSDYILEQRNRETVESEVTNPTDPDRSSTQKTINSERDMWLSAKKV